MAAAEEATTQMKEHMRAEELKQAEDGDPELKAIMDALRENLKKRGANGIAGLARKFRIIDDSGDGNLDVDEFKKCMKEMKTGLDDEQATKVFKFFDEDDSGTITYDEFLLGVRGELNERRTQLVLMAFDVIDKDGSGILDIDDITEAYDASKHPDVIAGKKSTTEILREFMDTFDGGEKDGKVYPDEFVKYYSNISASIDLDDYFELMIRNAWHIPGGEGWCANTANKRVLVTDPETGEQRIECIQNDLGMGTDEAEIQKRLAAQGSTGVLAKGGAKGAGMEVGVQTNKNPTAKLGGSNISFNTAPPEKVKSSSGKGRGMQKTSLW